MENLDFKEATPEQKKEISKILSKARIGMLFSTVKFFFGLLASNTITVIVGKYFLKDKDIDVQTAFSFCTSLVNCIFLVRYLNRKFKEAGENAVVQIKGVLSK